jgi:hypothetical protein
VGHVEFEFPHRRIERDDTEEENSNEEEENHEAEIIQQEDVNLKKLKHVRLKIASPKIHIEK